MLTNICEGRAEWGRQMGFRKEQELQISGFDKFMSYARLDMASDTAVTCFVELSYCVAWNISNPLDCIIYAVTIS